MGKSTLVARFVLSRPASLPHVYLDCDRPGLIAQEPLTLLSEVVRQLGLQFPAHKETAQRLRAQWLQELTHGAANAPRESNRVTTVGRARMLQEFRAFVAD